VAVFPPSAAREDLLHALPPGGRFTRPAKWHLTLAFLGELNAPPPPAGPAPTAGSDSARTTAKNLRTGAADSMRLAAGDSMRIAAGDSIQAVAEALAVVPRLPSFCLRLVGGGRFGQVTWAGVAGDLEALGELRESVRVALDGAGFPIDPRPFRPHLTVSYRQERGLLTTLARYAGPSWPVTGFALVESSLGNYHTRHEWPLATGS
jgi:2'-5' RNA ligase